MNPAPPVTSGMERLRGIRKGYSLKIEGEGKCGLVIESDRALGVGMRIAITGTTGRVGSALVRRLSRRHEVVELPRSVLDFDRPETWEGVLGGLECEVFLNPAGMTSLEACEAEPEAARRSNVEWPGRLAEWAWERGVRLVHFSTDYVLDGEVAGLRDEGFTALPISEYGRTKWEGERLVLRRPGHVVMRVSWVFGPEKPSFVDGVRARALAGEPLDAVEDKWSLPTYTGDLAEWVERLLEVPVDGVLHACQSGEPVSWKGMAEVVVDELSRMGLVRERLEVAGTRLDEVKAFRAKRPRHTAMDNRRLAAVLGWQPCHWESVLRQYIRESR